MLSERSYFRFFVASSVTPLAVVWAKNAALAQKSFRVLRESPTLTRSVWPEPLWHEVQSARTPRNFSEAAANSLS